MKSDFKNEVIEFIITIDELKDQTLVQIVNEIMKGDMEAKLNASLVLKELIESQKNFNFKTAGIHQKLFEVVQLGDDLAKRATF